MNSNIPVALGFDIGGSKTKIGLVTGQGEIISCTAIPTSLAEQSIDVFLSEGWQSAPFLQWSGFASDI